MELGFSCVLLLTLMIWCVQRWFAKDRALSVARRSSACVPEISKLESVRAPPNRSSLYTNLEISRSQIRLLAIISTTPEIICHLEVVDLIDKPAFNALSYVWGDPAVTEAIFVNGYKVQVTTNLASALRYAPKHLIKSKHAFSTKLWADAICINQDDAVEKSCQVSLMKDIYSQSGIVLCWLGKPNFEVHVAMQAIETVAHERSIRCAEDVDYKSQKGLLDSVEQLRRQLKNLNQGVSNTPLLIGDETCAPLDIIRDVDIYALANALRHMTDMISGELNKPYCMADTLFIPTMIKLYHDVGGWHNQFCERTSKVDPDVLKHTPSMRFLLDLLSFRLRKFSEMCKEFVVLVYRNEADSNLEWLIQHQWLHEVKEVVGIPPIGPAQTVFDLPYWSRIWIRQEMILAKHPLFVCGARSLTMESLESYSAWVGWIVNSCPSADLGVLNKDEVDKLVLAHNLVWKLLRHIFECRQSMDLPVGSWIESSHHKLNTWWASPNARASDPKDYYYGFLGITKLELKPDYNKSVGLICREFMVEYLRQFRTHSDRPAGGPLGLLMFAGIGYGWKTYQDMPSWGPNFPGQAHAEKSPQGDSDAIIMLDPRGLQCIFMSESDAKITGSELVVSVIILDCIQEIGPRISDYGKPELWHHTGLPIAWAFNFAMRNKSYVSGGHPLTALRALLEPSSISYNKPDGFSAEFCLGFAKFLGRHSRRTLHRELPREPVPARLFYLINLFDQVPKSADPEDQEAYESNLACKSRPYNQTIAETKKGYVGRFPAKIQEGDLICLLNGLDQVAVLRPTEKNYTFVGTCFIAGMTASEQIRSFADSYRLKSRRVTLK